MPKDKNYQGGLNLLHESLKSQKDYYFFEHFELNRELLDYLFKTKDKTPLFVFTKGTIQESGEIKEDVTRIFKQVYSTERTGLSKTDPESYKQIAKEIGVKPGEIFFTDDNKENIEAAEEAGLKVLQYKDNKSLFSALRNLH